MSTPKTDDFVFETRDAVIGGKKFKFRELSVEENDECSDGARDENGLINGRTMMRLMIIQSAVEPKIDSELLSKMPQRVYLRLCDIVNDLNNPDTLGDGKDDGEGND